MLEQVFAPNLISFQNKLSQRFSVNSITSWQNIQVHVLHYICAMLKYAIIVAGGSVSEMSGSLASFLLILG